MNQQGIAKNISEAQAQKYKGQDTKIFRDSSSPEGAGVYKAILPSGEIEEIGGGILKTFKREITSAELLAWGNTPIELVKAPGVGKSIIVQSAAWKTSEGVSYGGADLGIRISFNPAGADTVASSKSILKFKDRVEQSVIPNSSLIEILNNKALVASSISVGNNPSGGDLTLTVFGTYVIFG